MVKVHKKKLCSPISSQKFLIYFRATRSDVYIKEILQAHVTSKPDVMQFTIKTQEISKPFSLRPIPSSSQD